VLPNPVWLEEDRPQGAAPCLGQADDPSFPALIRLPVEANGRLDLVMILPWASRTGPRSALLNRVGLAAKWPPPFLALGS